MHPSTAQMATRPGAQVRKDHSTGFVLGLALAFLLILFAQAVQAARIKDIASVSGMARTWLGIAVKALFSISRGLSAVSSNPLETTAKKIQPEMVLSAPGPSLSP